MPTVKRKSVPAVALPDALAALPAEQQASRQVFYLAATGEVFADYEQYAARLSFYHQRIFQCELSGKSNLTYFEAVESERQHTRAIQAQFPDALKAPILRAVQFQRMARLNELVDRVHEHVKARYFVGETLSAEIDGARARVVIDAAPSDEITLDAEAPLAADMDAREYEVRRAAKGKDTRRVRGAKLSRGRHALSKSMLRKFLRDSVYKDAALGGVWVARAQLVHRFQLPTEMPAEVAAALAAREDKKRRRAGADDATPLKRGARAKASDEAPAPRVLKYPCEDLLLDALTPDELQAETPGELARRVARPVPSTDFTGIPPELLESFLAVYYFFVTLGQPLGVSSIAMDDFEAALRHAMSDPPCALLGHVHGVLLNAIVRDGAHTLALAPAALAQRRKATETDATPEAPASPAAADDQEFGSDLSDLGDAPENEVLGAASDMGRGWERRVLDDDMCTGWERQLVGCLAACATPEAMPRLYSILGHLCGVPYGDEDLPTEGRSAAERYPSLSLSDKVAVLWFLCEMAVLTRNVKAYYDECEMHLVDLRRERTELGRTRKQMLEELRALDEAHADAGDTPAAPSSPALAPAPARDDSDDSDSERDELVSDDDDKSDASDAALGTERYKRITGSRQEALRERALAREEEAARLAAEQARWKEQARESKQLREERRRYEDTLQRIAKREDAIERDMRRCAQVPRLRPLGQDRFLDRYYWLDGLGACTPTPGAAPYQAARLWVQAPSRREWEALARSFPGGRDALDARRETEYAEPPRECGAWGVYTQPEQVEELLAWLRPRGVREHALKAQLLRHRASMESAMRRRTDDIALGVREPVMETRRSARVRVEQPLQMRLPYMQWRNHAVPYEA